MGEKPLAAIEIREFAGLFSNIDPHDLQAGQAQVQTNLMCVRAGELVIRRGMRELVFDVENTA